MIRVFDLFKQIDALTICFLSSGLVMLLMFYFLARTSATCQRDASAMCEEISRTPRTLHFWELEGYEVIELYEDFEQGTLMMGKEPGLLRTAKLRDPSSGRLILARVLSHPEPWR